MLAGRQCPARRPLPLGSRLHARASFRDRRSSTSILCEFRSADGTLYSKYLSPKTRVATRRLPCGARAHEFADVRRSEKKSKRSAAKQTLAAIRQRLTPQGRCAARTEK